MMGKIITGTFALVGVASTAVAIAGFSALVGVGLIINQVEKDGSYTVEYVPAEERKANKELGYFRVVPKEKETE